METPEDQPFRAVRFNPSFEATGKIVPQRFCVLCDQPYEGYGHNPAPLADTGRCCDLCNDRVAEARLALGAEPFWMQDVRIAVRKLEARRSRPAQSN